MNYLLSLGLIAAGFIAVRFSLKLVKITGTMGSVENILGSGGTYTVVKLIGIGLVVAGIYILFNPVL